jgi:hypothetical protein
LRSDERIEACDSGWLRGQILLDTDETIPALADLLAKWPISLPLLIECKTSEDNAVDLAEAVAGTLRSFPRNAGIMSFDPTVSQTLWARKVGVPRGLVIDAEWPADFCEQALKHARPDFLAVDVDLLGAPWIGLVRERMPIYCWTIQTAAQREQAEVHADALIWEGDGRPGN